jgi:hypothetical protein
MTELNAEVPSTVIDNDAPVPGGAEFRPDVAPEPVVEAPKPMSLEDALNKAAADTKEGAEKDEPVPKPEKPKVEDKTVDSKTANEAIKKAVAERGNDGKFTAKPKAEPESPAAAHDGVDAEVGQEREAPKLSEVRDINRAPAHFLPRAKEAWAGVNVDVRGEVHRMMENYEKGLEEGREAMDYRKDLREFDDLAKGAGTTVKAALANYVAIDNQLKTDPVGGIERILRSINITPEQYANHILGQQQMQRDNPQGYAQSQEMQTLRQQNQQLQAQIQQVNQRLEQEASQRAAQQVEQTLFAEVRQQHPRFDELRPIVLKIWNSDLLPSNMNERDRLYAAVDHAERLSPVGSNARSEPLEPAPNAQRPLNPAGSKSVKGSLSYGAEVPRKSAKLSLDESLKMAARSVNG